MKEKEGKPRDKEKIVDEHFWFTAITVGFNSFTIEKLDTSNCYVIMAASTVNLYAIFLILHRAAAHADKLWYPPSVSDIEEKDKRFYHKGIETWCHICIAVRIIPYVVFQMSGALFYLLLIILSFLGVFGAFPKKAEPDVGVNALQPPSVTVPADTGTAP